MHMRFLALFLTAVADPRLARGRRRSGIHFLPGCLPAHGRLWARAVALLLALCDCIAAAHDIPNDVKVQAFVKPEAQHLTLLVRVPMAAMREVDFPLRAGGYLDLARVEPALRTAARLWIAD